MRSQTIFDVILLVLWEFYVMYLNPIHLSVPLYLPHTSAAKNLLKNQMNLYPQNY